MKIFFPHSIKNFFETVHLSREEKDVLRREMAAHMGATPVRTMTSSRQVSQIFLTRRYMIMTLAVIVTLVFGGGMSYAAENTIPGDVLYPVKVHINEEMRGAFIVNPEAKARWEGTRVERRLDELAELAAKGELKEGVKEGLEKNIEEHAHRVEAMIASVAEHENANAAVEVRADVEAKIKAKEKIIAKAHPKYHVKINIASVLDMLGTTTTMFAASSTASITTSTPPVTASTSTTSTPVLKEKGPNVEAAANGKMNAALHKIEEVNRFILQAKEKYGEESVARAEVHLATAQSVFSEGKAALDRGMYREAFRLFQDAHVKAEEAKFLVEFRKKFNIEVHLENGSTTTASSTQVIRPDKDAVREKTKEEHEKFLEKQKERSILH